jgi:hypothetical protein
MCRTAIAVLLASMSLAAPLWAAENPQPDRPSDRPADFDNPRFTFHPVGDGYVRLDMQSGATAMCRPGSNGWACVLAPDERLALDAEMGRLQRENALLKNLILDHGLPLPEGAGRSGASGAQMSAGAPPPGPKAPSAKSGRMMEVMARAWRRLVDMMADIQRDVQRKI